MTSYIISITTEASTGGRTERSCIVTGMWCCCKLLKSCSMSSALSMNRVVLTGVSRDYLFVSLIQGWTSFTVTEQSRACVSACVV